MCVLEAHLCGNSTKNMFPVVGRYETGTSGCFAGMLDEYSWMHTHEEKHQTELYSHLRGSYLGIAVRRGDVPVVFFRVGSGPVVTVWWWVAC